jgi:anthranilate phosphoribosyltransferase
VSECANGAVKTFYLHPADVGVTKSAAAALVGGTAEENAAIMKRVIDGERGAPRDVVLLNAGAALFIAGRVASIQEGMAQAGRSIDDGRTRDTLERLIACSNQGSAGGQG